MSNLRSTVFGSSNQWQNLVFDGDERKYELWEAKILGYLKLKGKKEVLDVGEIDADKKELTFAGLGQQLNKRSLSLEMHSSKDNAREALRVLRAHYAGRGKPIIIKLYYVEERSL